MSSHAAFRPDGDLIVRAAEGDAAAACALIARHGAALQQGAIAATGDPARAAAATAATFAALLTGALHPAPRADAEWLASAVAAQAATIGAAPTADLQTTHPAGVASDDALAAAVARALPPGPRAALLAAARGAATEQLPPREPGEPVAATDEPTVRHEAAGGLPLGPTTPDDVRRVIAVEEAGRQRPGSAARRLTAAGHSLDRYVERQLPLRWLVPVAIVAVLAAIWTWRQLPGAQLTELPFPDPRVGVPTAPWPTLPPRNTKVVAQADAPPTAIQAAPATPSPAARPPAKATAPASVAPPTATAVPPTAAPAPPLPAPQPTDVGIPTPRPPALAPPPPPVTTPPPALSTAAPPTATRTPQPTPTRTPANPAALVLATQQLEFGVEVGPRVISFGNPGGEPLEWRVVADSTWIELSQRAGTLSPGGTQAVAVSIARGDLPTGGYNGAIQVVSGGGEALVPVTMAVSPSNTTISAFAEPTAPIGALGCAEPTTYGVSAAIGGDRAPQKATLYYAVNGGPQRTKALAAAGGRYGATLGPFTETGVVLYSLVVTEADGAVVRSASYSLRVAGCPTQVRPVPVVPPVAQPFALAGGGRTLYTFTVTQPGTLLVTLRWKGGAQRLSTLLYGPRRDDQPYEQRTGVGALAWAFPVTEADVDAGGSWALHLLNYEGAEANGTFELTFTPLGQPLPTATPATTPTAPVTPLPTPTRTPTPTAPPPAQPTPTKPAPTTPPSTTPTAPRSTAPGTPRTP